MTRFHFPHPYWLGQHDCPESNEMAPEMSNVERS